MTPIDLYQERLQLALEAAGLDLWENNLTTGEVTQRVSRVFADLGYDNQEALAYVDDLYAIVHPDDIPLVQQAVADHMAGATAQYRCEFRLRSQDGRWVWYANYGKIMDDDGGRQGKRFIGVTFNIDDRKQQELLVHNLNQQLEQQNVLLQKLATTDALTGLSNRRVLVESGEKECRRADRTGHSPLSLLMLDIDHFKLINDTWGHPAGDKILQAMADLCRGSFRQGIDVIARIGGEEFAILMPDTAYEDALLVAERLRQSIETLPVALGHGQHISCTVSLGVVSMTVTHQANADFNDLLIHADRALYRAKAQGRNCVVGGLHHGAVDGNHLSGNVSRLV